jgi:hypothetical protein
LFSVDARKTFLLNALLSSRSGDDCCVIRPLVRGLCIVQSLIQIQTVMIYSPLRA